MTESEFRLVCCLPTYAEGPLAVSALDSVVGHVDELVVWEGPAGRARVPEGCPPTPDLSNDPLVHYRVGEWPADHEKRTAMVRYCRERWHDRPLWVLWLDADELLVNAAGLRDVVRAQMYEDQTEGRSIATPDNMPTGGIILRYVEADGSMAKEWGRLVRGDMIRRYTVSNLVVEMVGNRELRLGRRLELAEEWRAPRSRVHGPVFVLDPPLPGEPHFVHRSHLRHPYRANLRLHEAEHERLVELGLPTGAP